MDMEAAGGGQKGPPSPARGEPGELYIGKHKGTRIACSRIWIWRLLIPRFLPSGVPVKNKKMEGKENEETEKN